MFREEHGLVLSGLIRYTGDIQLAEDALQDAFVSALGAWRDDIPNNPAAWLSTTAKRKAIDRVRRSQRLSEKYQTLAASAEPPTDTWSEAEPIEDDRLRLIFTCCHPALDPDAQVALTLRTVGGLTTSEISRAFLVSESTMGQRLVRAKRKIRDAGIPYRVPESEELPARLPGVLAVVYLIFNEGYAASAGEAHVRSSLTDEAIRLATIIDELLPDEPEVLGLLALMLFHDARVSTRTDEAGAVVLLPDQDRARWDTDQIVRATELMDRAVALRRPGPYQIQAAIASLHAEASSADDTDWTQIVALYGALRMHGDSPIIRLNQAVAVAMMGDATAALRTLDDLTVLDGYSYYHAARGSLLAAAGQTEDAAAEYGRALEATASSPERRFLEAKLAELAGQGD